MTLSELLTTLTKLTESDPLSFDYEIASEQFPVITVEIQRHSKTLNFRSLELRSELDSLVGNWSSRHNINRSEQRR